MAETPLAPRPHDRFAVASLSLTQTVFNIFTFTHTWRHAAPKEGNFRQIDIAGSDNISLA